MKRSTRKGPSRTRPAIIRRAWYVAHLEARARGAPIVEAQLLAQAAARVAGAVVTSQRRRRQRREAIQRLKGRGAAAPQKNTAPEPRRRRRTAGAIIGNARYLEREHDRDVQARRRAIAARDRKRGTAPVTAIGVELQRATSAPSTSGRDLWTAMLQQLERAHHEAAAERRAGRFA